jgi:hypothetical protein
LDNLSSPSKDIPALARKLRGMNFAVTELYDLDEKSMKKSIKSFKKRLEKNPNAIALFYYSGHGSQAYGESYLIPIDGDTRDEADVEADGVKVETIAQKMANTRTKANILFLDACRDVPTGTMGGTKGLGQVKRQPSSTIIIYSTSKNKTAKDDRLFNKTVLKKLALNMPFSSLANDISYAVGQKTSRKQVPELLSTGIPNIILNGGRVPPPPTPTPRPTSKWITPTNSTCTNNGGKLYKGVCSANWENAKKICSASGGQLPSRADLKKVVVDCGGSFTTYGNKDWDSLTDKNIANKAYQSCYKEKGFNGWYWTREEKDSSIAWGVYFGGGNDFWSNKSFDNSALCVR